MDSFTRQMIYARMKLAIFTVSSLFMMIRHVLDKKSLVFLWGISFLMIPPLSTQGDGYVAAAPISNRIVVPSGAYVNLRSGPGTQFEHIGRVGRGIRLPVIEYVEDNGGWYHVMLRSAQDAWVASWYVVEEPVVFTSQLAPISSTLFISVDTRPGVFDRLSMVERLDEMLTIFNGSDAGGTSHEYFTRLVQLLLMNPETNLDEIRPWLGDEVAIVNLQCLSAVMSEFLMGEGFVETPSPDVAIIAPVLDPGYAREFLNRVLTSGTLAIAPSRELNYGGYTYNILNDPTHPDYRPDIPAVSMGIIEEFIVFAQGERVFNEIIDVANGQTSLHSSTGFLEVYTDLDRDSMLRVFVSPQLFCPAHDPILFDGLLAEPFRNGEATLSGFAEDTQALQDYVVAMQDTVFQGYGVSFRNVNDALELELVSGVDREALQSLTDLSSQQIGLLTSQMGMELFGFLTPETLQVLTLGNLPEEYEELSQMAAEVPEDTFERATGIPQDVLKWIDGSITMGFIDYPVFDGIAEDQPPYFLMIIESPTPESTQNAYDALIAAGQEQTNAMTQIRTLNDLDVTSITSEGLTGIRSMEVITIEQYTVLVTGGNLDRVLENARRTEDGQFVPDWRLLAGIPVGNIDTDKPENRPLVAALDLSRIINVGAGSRLQAAAIVSPPQVEGEPSRITIICSICRRDELCWPDR